MKQLSDDTLLRHAISCLIGHCESIAEHGRLSEPSERSLRMLIANVLSVFHMPPKVQPLPQEFPDDSYEKLLADMTRLMRDLEAASSRNEPLLRLLVNNEVKR